MSSEDVAKPAEKVGELIVKPDGEVKVDKRKTISKFNAFKHGRRAKSLPLLCNNCNYRAEDAGGGGQCPAYKKDSICSLSAEYERYFKQFDTRNPDHIKSINEMMIQRQLTKIFVAEQMSAWDGGVPDKVLDRQIHVYLDLLKMQKELIMPKMIMSQTNQLEDKKTGTVRTAIQQLFMSGVNPDQVAPALQEEETDDVELTELEGEDDEDGQTD